MGMASGYAVFQDPEVNTMLKRVLNVWGEYLTLPDSRKCLGTDAHGWFGEVGKRELTDVANAATPFEKRREFEELFHCEPRERCHGFRSWDDFFYEKVSIWGGG
jgi:phosphatidylserine decarboxylase